MKGTLEGTGEQAILKLRPRFYWDALNAMEATGPAKAGGANQVTIYETTSQVSTGKYLVWHNDKQLSFMADGIDTTAGLNKCLGSVGAFYASTTNYFTDYASAKYGFAVVAPTDPSQLIEDTGIFPGILRGADIATIPYSTLLDTSLDIVNDCVVERSLSRSATLVRTLQIFVKNYDDGVSSPDGTITLGWNETAGTRTTYTTQWRAIADGWFVGSILVAGGATTGYASVKATADTGTWQIALPLWFTSGSTLERIPRAGLSPVTGLRNKYALKTVNAEMVLRPSGWLAMSMVLPDRSVSYGHTDNLGNANYRFLGMLNLDCATWRMRVSMSDTYDRVVVNLGDTSGVNFAYLDGPTDWDDFSAIGIVAVWYTANGFSGPHTYAALYVNGEKLDSIEDPATWYPQYGPPGTMYVGINEENGVLAETFISRVAYGTDRMHRSTARILSAHMGRLARGKNVLWSI